MKPVRYVGVTGYTQSAAKFLEEMLRLIRGLFFAKLDPKKFFQEVPMLELAISYPADWLKRRGVAAEMSRLQYRAILMTVITTIRQHGKRPARFSAYFLHCVQTHMQHHGEEYYQAAKAPRSIGAILPKTMSKFQRSNSRQSDPDRTVEVLAETHSVLNRRRGIQKGKNRASEPDLFGHCKASATGRQNPRKVSQTFGTSGAQHPISSQTSASPPRDS